MPAGPLPSQNARGSRGLHCHWPRTGEPGAHLQAAQPRRSAEVAGWLARACCLSCWCCSCFHCERCVAYRTADRNISWHTITAPRPSPAFSVLHFWFRFGNSFSVLCAGKNKKKNMQPARRPFWASFYYTLEPVPLPHERRAARAAEEASLAATSRPIEVAPLSCAAVACSRFHRSPFSACRATRLLPKRDDFMHVANHTLAQQGGATALFTVARAARKLLGPSPPGSSVSSSRHHRRCPGSELPGSPGSGSDDSDGEGGLGAAVSGKSWGACRVERLVTARRCTPNPPTHRALIGSPVWPSLAPHPRHRCSPRPCLAQFSLPFSHEPLRVRHGGVGGRCSAEVRR